MKCISSLIVLLLISFLPVHYLSGADRQSANELFLKSGLEKQMQDIGKALWAGYNNNYRKSGRHTAYDKKIYQNIGQVIENSFDLQQMKEIVVHGMMKKIETNDMNQILSWFNSSIGKKVTALEERASSQEGIEETRNYIRNLRKKSFSAERIRLIKDLSSSMNIVETTIDIVLTTQFALMMTTDKAKKKLSHDDIKRLLQEFEKNRSRIKPMTTNQVYGSLLYTYQVLSDEELQEYVRFAKSESGQTYARVSSLFMLQAITESSLQFAWKISHL